MYLQACRRNNPGPGRWFFQDGRVAGSADLDFMYARADAALNSDKQAHDAFEVWQGELPEPTRPAHQAFSRLVHREIGEDLCNGVRSWPVEAIAWALLKVWIENAKTERRLRAAQPV